MNKKTTLATALGLVFGGAAFSANANLTSSATLSFVLGTQQTVCNYGTTPPCGKVIWGVSDIVGSYFVMDTNGNGVEAGEKTGIGSFNGIHLGTAQAASGSHNGGVNGTEAPNIDSPWTFFSGTGMHQTTSAITASAVVAGAGTLDMSGWNVTWNGLPNIPLVQLGDVTIACDTASCSDNSNYTADAAFHVNGAGFTTVAYFLHLEGAVAVPAPAEAWLFGSGLLGFVGMVKKRKAALKRKADSSK